MASLADSHQVFQNLTTKFSQLLYGRTEGDRELMNQILDGLNSLDYRYTVVSNNTRAVLLVNQFCNLVPPDDSFLVAKCCNLITSLVTRQQVLIEGRTLAVTIDWIIQALKQVLQVVMIDILVTLDALLRSNVQHIYSLIPNIVSKSGTLISIIEKDFSPEITLLALQCLEACCSVPDNYKSLNANQCHEQYELCFKIFLNHLLMERNSNVDEFIYCKILISCMTGIQNIFIQCDDFTKKEIGLILGISKSFMVYQLNGIDFLVPQKLLPSTLSIPESCLNKTREKKGGKVTRQRKQRPSGYKKEAHKSENNDQNDNHFNGGYIPATTTLDVSDDPQLTSPSNRLRTSDSDFSDSDSGRSAKISIMEGRVRQASLHLLLNVCKLTDKRTMFSYWSSFIPDAPLSGSHSLTNCILKDPSPKGRMAALNVLLSLLSSSKMYLSQAEYSERISSFTPFSVILGSIIKELHHCLSLALNESSFPVLTQALKCIASLVQATPYHRLAPGLITKVIRNVKSLIYHKDATVQVAALIVLGCVLASDPVLKETKDTFLRNIPTKPNEKVAQVEPAEEIDFADFSSDEEPEIVVSEVPWLLLRCFKNLGVKFDNGSKLIENTPAPVKLESLLVISAMSRNYFETLILPHMCYVTKALETCLLEKHNDVRLHAGRTVDFIGQAMNLYLTNVDDRSLNVDKSVTFWLTLLGDSLVELLQCEQYPTLRTIGCDCIGSIGTHAFEQLPRDKQLLCITLLFSCSRDHDNTVKGSAVRALAISVLYPSLREDIGFIMDTAEAIHRTLQDENIGLRVKSSWSLGNLSDALVLNMSTEGLEEISDNSLLNLINDSIIACNDNDKIKSNAVRAVGNLLQLINKELSGKDEFRLVSERAIMALVKCSSTGSNMKVRWNACYALGNILRNVNLYHKGNSWLRPVFSNLSDLVIGFKNFKVRINSALALASCPERELYGPYYLLIWNALIKALENSENMEDFSEYKHRDHLIEQICLALGHLISLVTFDDLISLEDTFSEIALKTHMQKVYDRLLPEKSTILFLAQEHLLTLKVNNSQHKEVIVMLKNVFSNDISY